MAWTDKLAEFLRLNDGEQAYTGYPQMQVGLNKPRQAGYATGFLEGATGVDSMQPKNPITDPNYDQYAKGKNIGEAVGIGAMAIPGYAMALKAGAPKAYRALENYMVKTGGMIPLEAYHGTPHKIQGQFDINKVGTGEGAQAYGHGMYFAENPAVATEYKNMLGSKIDVNGKPLYNANKTIGSTGNTELDDYLVANLGDVKATRKQLLNDIKEIRPTNPEAAKEMQTTLADLRKANVGVQNTGNLYKVDIPDEQIPMMLDWDKPLSEQQKILNLILSKDSGFTGQTKREIQELSKQGANGEKLIKLFEKDQKDLSEKLSKLGIPGIRYLDENSRNLVGGRSMVLKTKDGWVADVSNEVTQGIGGFPLQTQSRSPAFKTKEEAQAWADKNTKQGTSNFVVFEPSTVKILEENSKPLTRKELIEKQVKDLKD